MVSAAQAIAWFDPWLGYRDDAGTKIWMIGPDPHWPGSAYCGKTQSDCAYELGLDISPTTHARVVFVPHVVNDAKKEGLWYTSYHSKPGDWVIFDWLLSGYRDGYADHIGMILHNDPSLPYVYTIEGNTKDENNVGPRGIFVRRRWRVDILGCVNRQSAYTASTTPITTPVTNPNVAPELSNQNLNKWVDSAHIKTLQKILKVAVDGIAGKDTYTALQKKLGTTADGVLSGPASRAVVALQKAIGLKGKDVDGVLGVVTGATLAKYLDKGGDFSTGFKANPVSPPTASPVIIRPVSNPIHDPSFTKLAVDGVAGSATVKAWQRYMGTTVDGSISGQDAGWHSLMPSAIWTTVRWQNPGTADGSQLIVQVQKKFRLKADGVVGPATAKAIQGWVGVTKDGILGVNSVKALQRKLNSLLSSTSA